jgi:hypothetical protein
MSIAERPQFTIRDLSPNDREGLHRQLKKNHVKIAAFIQEYDRYIFIPGEVDPSSSRNRKQIKKAREICSRGPYSERQVIEVVDNKKSSSDVINQCERILNHQRIPLNLAYEGHKGSVWLVLPRKQVSEGGKALCRYLK